MINLPLHLLIARLFSLDNVFHGAFISRTREESKAGLIGRIYLLSCCALVTAEYKLIGFLLFPAAGS